jgi:hypothetical protein
MSMDICGYPWISMEIHRYPKISADIQLYPWISQDIPGYPGIYSWTSIDTHEIQGWPCRSMDFHVLQKLDPIWTRSIYTNTRQARRNMHTY